MVEVNDIEHGKIYKAIKCSRCGDTRLLAHLGVGELDGGYTRYNKFEPEPEGWGDHNKIGLLCPKCEAAYQKLVRDFMSEEEL